MNISDICQKIVENPLETEWLDNNLIIKFLNAATEFYSKQPNLVRMQGRTVFSGDIHADFDSMIKALKLADDENANIVFLGDIVDRGSHNVECMNLALARIMLEPDRIFFTRGNHEFEGINTKWGFMDAVVEKYPETVYWLYNGIFTQLPLAALQNEKVYGVHGGLSRHSKTLEEIDALEHAGRGFRDEYMDILWNDPALEEQKGFEMNKKRSIFYTFGEDVFNDFMKTNNLELFIRGHTKQKPGHKYFFDGRLISIFTSADHYKETVPSVVLVEDDLSHKIVKL